MQMHHVGSYKCRLQWCVVTQSEPLYSFWSICAGFSFITTFCQLELQTRLMWPNCKLTASSNGDAQILFQHLGRTCPLQLQDLQDVVQQQQQLSMESAEG